MAHKPFKTQAGAARASERLTGTYWTRAGVVSVPAGFAVLLQAGGTTSRPADVRLVFTRSYADGFDAVEAILGRGNF